MQAQGHEVHSSSDPHSVLDVAGGAQARFDLLMVDISLFNRYGWGLLDRFDANVPLLINSGRDLVELQDWLSIRQGATEIITTPFSSAQLRGAIERSLEKSYAVRTSLAKGVARNLPQ